VARADDDRIVFVPSRHPPAPLVVVVRWGRGHYHAAARSRYRGPAGVRGSTAPARGRILHRGATARALRF
jgi:hypothetical protein